MPHSLILTSLCVPGASVARRVFWMRLWSRVGGLIGSGACATEAPWVFGVDGFVGFWGKASAPFNGITHDKVGTPIFSLLNF